MFKGTEERLTNIPFIIDGAYSKPTWNINKCMCITRSHAGNKSLWSLQHARPLSNSELARLQGISGSTLARLDYSCMSDRQFAERLGNAFTLTDYKDVLLAGLRAVRLMP